MFETFRNFMIYEILCSLKKLALENIILLHKYSHIIYDPTDKISQAVGMV